MAVMHHAINEPETVKSWLIGWSEKMELSSVSNIEIENGFIPISEPDWNQSFILNFIESFAIFYPDITEK
jgi:hypothetical protein